MQKLILLGILGFGAYSLTQKFFRLPVSKKGECFKEQTLASLALTMERKPLYSAASSGDSQSVSSSFVYLHKAALYLGNFSERYRFDDRDRVFREAGMSIVCQNLEAQAEAPEFADSYKGGAPSSKNYSLFSSTLAKDDLRIAWRRAAFEGLKQESLKKLQQLGAQQTNCLVRHFLTRIARAASMAPEQLALAKTRGLPSPEPLIKDWIDFHLSGLGLAHWLDEKASSLQFRGLPILCQDLSLLVLPKSAI